MADRYLASFCNNHGRARLAIVTPAGVERVVDLGENLLPFIPEGVTGIAVGPDRVWVVLQVNKTAVVGVFDRDFVMQSDLAVPGARDLHGVLPAEGDLHVVSTGTNELLTVDPETGAVRSVWSDGGKGTDRDHLNDLCRTAEGNLLLSRFGPRRPDGMRVGSVVAVDSGAILLEGLREPHSVTCWNGQVYVLESALGDLVRARPGETPERVAGIAGYARGLAIDDDYVVIGKSGYREASRSKLGDDRAAPLKPPHSTPAAARYSGVCFIPQHGGEIAWADTTAVGAEIYQIVPLPG